MLTICHIQGCLIPDESSLIVLVIQLWAREIQHPYLHAKILRTVCEPAPSSSICYVGCFALRRGTNTLIPSSPVIGRFPSIFLATSTAELFDWFTGLFWAWKKKQYHLVLSPPQLFPARVLDFLFFPVFWPAHVSLPGFCPFQHSCYCLRCLLGGLFCFSHHPDLFKLYFFLLLYVFPGLRFIEKGSVNA